MANTLGCAQDYEAVVHFQRGVQVHTRLEGVTSITWGRKLDDFSEASVTIAKRDVTADCLRLLGGVWETRVHPDGERYLHMVEPGVEPWMHELTIYRDRGIVWQGPITEVTETRDEFTIDARDVLFWLDRRVLSLSIEGQYVNQPTGVVLDDIMRATFPRGDPYHDPNIAEHWRIDRNTPGRYTTTEPLWRGSRTVGDAVRDIIKVGVDMFTLGRKIFLVPDSYRVEHTPYRLTDEHFTGDLEVHKLGLDLATEGFVAARPAHKCECRPDQQPCPHPSNPNVECPNPGESPYNDPPPVFGNWPDGTFGPAAPAWYGRITRFTESQTVNQRPDEACCSDRKGDALVDMAKSIRDYGFPCPKSVVVPDNSTLTPEAPITIGQLVPGRPVIVEMTGWATPVSEIFRINEIEVTWSPGESGGGSSGSGPEQVQVSLASMRQPPVDEGSTARATPADTPPRKEPA